MSYMVKVFLNVFFTLVLAIQVSSQGVEFFQGTWKDALEKARQEDKLLFVDAYAKWCGPCKVMSKNVFPIPEVGDFFNKNFINLKLDMEESDGVTFGFKYPVSAYPTMYFIDGEGKVVKVTKGGRKADALIELGQEALNSYDRSGKYEARYLEGDRSYDLMMDYVKALNAADKPSLKISNEYLNSQPDITDKQRIMFLLEAATEADSKIFDEVLLNKDKLISWVGREYFEEKAKRACEATAKKAIEFETAFLLEEAVSKAKKSFPGDADEFAAISRMNYNISFKNEKDFILAYKLLAKSSDNDPDKLKIIIDAIVNNFKDNEKMISDATMYGEKFYKARNDGPSLNYYVSLMIMNNEVDKAIKLVEKEREKAVKNGEKTYNFDGLLRLLNEKKS
jgi:thioredoxin-related protein